MTLFLLKGNVGFKYELRWTIHQSLGKVEEDMSFVSIIDGSVLKVTPMRQMVVPPPISAFELHLPNSISGVMFANFADFNQLCVISDSNEIFTFSTKGEKTEKCVKITGAGGNGFVPKCTTLGLEKVAKLSSDFEQDKELYNWCWSKPDLAFAACEQMVYAIQISDGAILQTLILEEPVHAIISSGQETFAILQEGAVFNINDNLELVPWKNGLQLKKCSQFQVVQDSIIGLDDRSQRLYLDGQEISSGVTSFFIHSHFLMTTTTSHTLKCLPLNELSLNSWQSESVRALGKN